MKRYQALMTAEGVQILNERATILLRMLVAAIAILNLIYLEGLRMNTSG